MASFSFYAGESNNINNLSGSGLGFYGGSFGASVQVGAFNQTTFITNSNGTSQGPAADNVKFSHTASGIINSATGSIPVTHFTNQEATLNLRFTHSSSVQVQNVSVLIYDRTNTASGANGVTTYTYEAIHLSPTQGAGGSGTSAWTHHPAQPSGAVSRTLSPSPGISGLYAGNGSNSVRADTQHDWYVYISASPDSVGSKTFGLFAQCEYL